MAKSLLRAVEDDEVASYPLLRSFEQPNEMPFDLGGHIVERNEPVDLSSTELI